MSVQNSLVKQSEKRTFTAYITNDAVKNRINSMMSGKDGERFITSIISAVTINPVLAECDHGTILSAAMLGEALKLSPSPQLGQYYLVPFKNKKKSDAAGREVKDAQFQLGYKGYIQLAMRSGQYRDLDVIEVKEGEYQGKDKFTGKPVIEFIEDDDLRETLPVIGYFTYFELLNGFRKTMYWTKSKMLAHADKYSAAFSKDAKKGNTPKYDKVSFADFEAGKVPQSSLWLYSSFWYSDFDGMAFKTMLRHLISKWGIMSIDMQNAITNDMAVINENGQPEYVDNCFDNNAAEPEQPPAKEPKKVESKVVEMPKTEINENQESLFTGGEGYDPLDFPEEV